MQDYIDRLIDDDQAATPLGCRFTHSRLVDDTSPSRRSSAIGPLAIQRSREIATLTYNWSSRLNDEREIVESSEDDLDSSQIYNMADCSLLVDGETSLGSISDHGPPGYTSRLHNSEGNQNGSWPIPPESSSEFEKVQRTGVRFKDGTPVFETPRKAFARAARTLSLADDLKSLDLSSLSSRDEHYKDTASL